MADGGPEEGADPFAGWTFDDDFVADAARKEESADERVARLSRIDREHRRLEVDRLLEQKAARRRRRSQSLDRLGRLRLAIIGVGIVGLVAFVAVNTVNREAGENPLAMGDTSSGEVEIAGGRPPRSTEAQPQPLGSPAPHPESDAHRFIATQEDGVAPVAYDPCRPIHVVVNARRQPPGGDLALAEALATVSRATGLQFEVDGPTDEASTTEREAYQPDRYPDRWAPVLVDWTDPSANPDLAGSIAGTGGSASLVLPEGRVYVSGEVSLDGPQLGEVALRPDGPAQVRAIILHEIGHLLGLDHVDDIGELMYPEGSALTELGAGDLTGLAALGRGTCFPEL